MSHLADSIVLRASGMPLAFLCPGSVRPATVPVSEDGPAAALGTAVHEALQHLAVHDSIDWAALPALAARHGVNPEDLRMLCGLASNMWPEIKGSFVSALCEIPLSATLPGGYVLTGHVDLIAPANGVDGPVARVADWKTGRKDRDYSHQMRAYAALVMLDDPELVEVTVTAIWVREREIENYTMTRAGMRAWVRELLDRVAAWDGVYHPGRHCPHCPRSHECEAANALVRRDVAALSDAGLVARAENELGLMAPAEIIELHAKAQLVAGFAARVRDAIKDHVERTGDVVGNGLRLTVDVAEKRTIDPVKAWPVLEAEGFADVDFAECMDLHVSRVEKIVAKKAGRGKGAAAVRALGAKLDEAGAVAVRETKSLREKRA